MNSKEFAEMLADYCLAPWGEFRDWMGQIVSTSMAPYIKSGKPPLPREVFPAAYDFLQREIVPEQDTEQFFRRLTGGDNRKHRVQPDR